MGFVFIALAVTAGVICLWGLVAPRGQWRALASWSFRDPHAGEPGATAYAIRRVASGLGLAALLVVVGTTSTAFVFRPATPEKEPTAIELMWGNPKPTIVNRDILGIGAAPTDLVDVPILGYQAFEQGSPPRYLQQLKTYTRLGTESIPGLVGTYPDVGFAATDKAEIIVNVRAAILCIPRQAVVVETETAVQIGVFFGLPNPTDGSVPDHLEACADGQSLTGSLLIPVQLAAEVGDREVQSLDGTPLNEVPVEG